MYSCCTSLHCSRITLPRQSAPVSPPPMMITLRPCALISGLRVDALAGDPAVLLHEVVHGEMDPAQLASGHVDVARAIGADREHDRVEPLAQLLGGDVDADVVAGLEGDPLGLEQVDAPVDDPLLHLEIGDAVAEQATDAIRALEHGHAMSGAVELLRRGEPGGSGADDGDAPAGAMRRRLGADPALVECAVDDRLLDLLDRDRVVVDGEHACGFAGSRAEPAGELREVVGGVQPLDRGLPVVAMRRGRSTRG